MPASADLMEGFRALEDYQPRYLEAMAYYRGTIPERFATERIRALVQASGQTYQFRLSAIPVKVMSKRVKIATVISDNDAASQRLEVIRLANDMAKHEGHLHRQMFIYGDAYAFTWPLDPEQLDAEGTDPLDQQTSEALRESGVEIAYQSPLNARMMYDAEDGKRARYFIRRWCELTPIGEKFWRAEVWYADRVEPWISKPGAKGLDPMDWFPYVEDSDEIDGEPFGAWPLLHDWQEIPFKHARTELPYGRPEHEAAYGPQDAVTKAITTQVVVDIEAHGWPERYRLLDDQRLLDNGREPVDWGDPADAPDSIRGVSETVARRRGSGLEHTFTGTKAVGEYTPPDPGVLIAPIEQWVKLMSVVTETPLDELDPTVQLSGVSRQKADAPLQAKEEDRKLYLEGFWREVYTLALRMSGVDPGTVEVQWAPPEIQMDADWWDTAAVRQKFGVPTAQILAEANYGPDQIEAWLDKNAEEMALREKIAVLKEFGEALQSVGAAIALSVIDVPTASKIVGKIVGDMGGADVTPIFVEPVVPDALQATIDPATGKPVPPDPNAPSGAPKPAQPNGAKPAVPAGSK